jgi:hypothetical protein
MPPDEHAIRQIRDALGAVPVDWLEIYWLYAGKDGAWHLRRESGGLPPCWRSFATREAALTAVQIAAARCTSYCLYVQDADGNVTLEQAVAPNR